MWGREVHVADATRTYARTPVEGNRPLSMWSNRWSTMPVHAFPDLRLPRPDHRATLDHVPGSDVPVIRQPFDPSDAVPFWAASRFSGDLLYDRRECEDTGEVRDRSDGVERAEMAELLHEALRSVEAPPEQLARLGLG